MKKIESGRSMIEMLGVLAIIGVLSIGGLAGYTMAMNRHRANTLINAANVCITTEQTKTETGWIGGSRTGTTSCTAATYGFSGLGQIDVTQAGEEVTVKFTGQTDAVLNAIQSRLDLDVDNATSPLTVYRFTTTPTATKPEGYVEAVQQDNG